MTCCSSVITLIKIDYSDPLERVINISMEIGRFIRTNNVVLMREGFLGRGMGKYVLY